MVARERGTFANCTHVIVSLLKAWNVTVVWIVCDDAVFNATSRRYTPQIASKVANWIIVEVSLLTLYYHWQTLSISFFIRNSDC